MKPKTRLRNIYCCTLHSDKGHRTINVVASSFGEASTVCYLSILSWEDHDAYELVKIQLVDHAFTKI
jgi:hypothetical protein